MKRKVIACCILSAVMCAVPAFGQKYIDLHCHLDGSLTVEMAKTLAELQEITLPASDDKELESLLTVPEDCESLTDFLKCFPLPQSLMQTPEGLRESVRLVLENIKSQGVIYAEIRFAPQKHTLKGMTQEDAVKAALDGLKLSTLKANLILCLIRGTDYDVNAETIELARKYLVRDGGVVAVDLAGDEAQYPTSDYGEFFARAKGYGIPFTIHAGEADGAESVRCAVEFGASRIGHGVRTYESADVVELVRSRGVTLEVCPTSNRMTHAVSDMSAYPFMKYLADGVRVTLNTDDMGVENTTLADEFAYMKENFSLTAEQERVILNYAIDAAFTTEEVKERLRKEILYAE